MASRLRKMFMWKFGLRMTEKLKIGLIKKTTANK